MARTISYNKLWKLLIDKGWTKSELGKHANISPASIAKLGKGKTSRPMFYSESVMHLIVTLRIYWKP